MKRRSFILAGAAVPALALARQVGAATVRPPRAARFALGYHNGLDDGFWMPVEHRPFNDTCTQVNVLLLGVQGSAPAGRPHPLRRMDVELLYRVDETGDLPYRWAHLAREGIYAQSRGVAPLNLSTDRTAGIRVAYEYRDSRGRAEREQQDLPWLSAASPLLTPGFYALVGPSHATGTPPDWSALVMPATGSCAISTCDGSAPDFDALLISVEAA